jgi:formylglycine-generating enzyme required for sulfatase activity
MAEPEAQTETGKAQPESATIEAPPGMVRVPAGVFLYGRKKVEANLDEFWIDARPVTNADYAAFVEEHHRPSPRHWPPDGLTDDMLHLPVVFLTYAEAEAYAELNGKQLPTPAQFEKAAAGTEGLKYPWGNNVGQRLTNTRESGIGRLTPVDRFERGASPFGCLDMSGNVMHWTRGVYDEEKGTQTLKGCSFRHYLGATHWDYEGTPEKRQDCIGLRCVWKPARDGGRDEGSDGGRDTG